jgi:hypothetical protein
MRTYVEVVESEWGDTITLIKDHETIDAMIEDLAKMLPKFPNGEILHVHVCMLEGTGIECGDHVPAHELLDEGGLHGPIDDGGGLHGEA